MWRSECISNDLHDDKKGKMKFCISWTRMHLCILVVKCVCIVKYLSCTYQNRKVPHYLVHDAKVNMKEI